MSPERLLIVDDEPDVEALIRQKFRQEIKSGQLQFVFATDGYEALRVLETETDIDIVFTDINMPRMDGLTLLGKLQTREKIPTTVVVSAYSDQKNIRSAMNNGAFDFVTKPIEFDDFGATMQKTIRHNDHIKGLLNDRLLAERKESQLRRYFSPSIARAVALDSGALSAKGKRRQATFLFTDLADFSTLVENTTPSDIVDLVNTYFDTIVRIVFEHDGTLMKIVGDATHVIFGAPEIQSNHAQRAVDCALAIDRFATDFKKEMNSKSIALGTTRIGVNTGEAIIGSFGGERFFDYTAYGVAVNLSSRLEGANKAFGTHICVSEATTAACPDFFGRPIGRLELRGVSEPIEAFEPLHRDAENAKSIEEYKEAYNLLQLGHPDAKQAFADLVSKNPDDPLALLHLSRILSGHDSSTIKA